MKKKYILGALVFSSLSFAEYDTLLLKNQNVDLRLSNENVAFNYDFRIPRQKVFSVNRVSYNEYPQQSIEGSTGIALREKIDHNKELTVGGAFNYINIDTEVDDNLDIYYFNLFLGFKNTLNNGIFYKAMGSISPNIITWGDADNVYNLEGEIGFQPTEGSSIFVGYRHLGIESEFSDHFDDINYPYAGASIQF